MRTEHPGSHEYKRNFDMQRSLRHDTIPYKFDNFIVGILYVVFYLHVTNDSDFSVP